MNYNDLKDKCVREKKLTRLSSDIVTWEKEGQELVGKLLSIEDFEEGDYDQNCKKYLFDVGDRNVSTVFGSVGDKTMNDDKLIGEWIWIVFLGKHKGKKKKPFNKFTFDKLDKESCQKILDTNS